MTPEPPVLLPFAEALEKLCDRDLTRDLRDAEQLVWRLTDQPTATSGDVPTADSEIKRREVETIRAQLQWSNAHFALRSNLAARVNRGEFHLSGRPTSATAPGAVVVLPREAVDKATIDVTANTVEAAGEKYEDVRVILGPVPMAGEADQRRLPLLQALLRWCDPLLLLNIRRCERYFRADELRELGHPQLGAASSIKSAEHGLSGNRQLEVRGLLENSWSDLARDLQRRIAGGEIYLTGVQTKPTLMMAQQQIPATWAFDLQFNFGVMSVAAHGHRWTAVECSLDPTDVSTEAEHTPPDPVAPASCAMLKPEEVADLSDELILALLEEHHRRVVASPDANLFPPGKISFIPLIKRMMEARAESGDLLPELTSEARWLEAWIKEKAPTHHTPTAATIENNLRSNYRLLNPRSKATI
ncbi:MAG TPA: hypothetical protein VIL69_18430 [Roseomonas sp.]|jgi:hypothetical protein